MSDVVLSDDYLESHRTKPKKVKRLAKRWIQKPGRHKQKNHIVEAEDGSTNNIYVRQNMDDIQDFSCGLVLTKRGGKPISLVRYNGSSHVHGEIRYDYHIHQAAANAVESGRKIDSHANQTDRYKTVEGALACLIEDCQVSGIDAKHDGQDLLDLFDGT